MGHLVPSLNLATLAALGLGRGIGSGPAEKPEIARLDAQSVTLAPVGLNYCVCTGGLLAQWSYDEPVDHPHRRQHGDQQPEQQQEQQQRQQHQRETTSVRHARATFNEVVPFTHYRHTLCTTSREAVASHS